MLKKLFISLLAVLVLVGCQNQIQEESQNEQEEQETVVEAEGLNILSPQGAPALTLIPVVNGKKNTVDTVEGADVISAELVKSDSSYDVILAPTNLGAKLYATGNSEYLLYAIVDWGNLYIVGSDDSALDVNHEVAAFGEEAVPGLVFKKAYGDIQANVTFYHDVSDAREMLLSGHADAALLAEPAATATIAAAKQNDMELKIISDVQQKWGDEGFPMAAMFVKKSSFEEKPEVYQALFTQMKDYNESVDINDPTALVEDINMQGAEFYGVPNAEIIGKCYDRINIKMVLGKDSITEIKNFLELFDIIVEDSLFASK